MSRRVAGSAADRHCVMSHSPTGESRVLDYAPAKAWGWRDVLRLLVRLTPLWCLVIVGVDFATDLRPERLPWRVAQTLCAVVGIVCLARRERRLAAVCFVTLLLLIVFQPSFDRAT